METVLQARSERIPFGVAIHVKVMMLSWDAQAIEQKWSAQWLALFMVAMLGGSMLIAPLVEIAVMMQEVVHALRHPGAAAPTGTNIVYIGGNGNETSGAGATVSVAYTCTSTANYLKVFVGGQGSSLSLSDTGGQAAGATNLGGLNDPGQNDNANYWIMGCASGANTIKGTAGSGGTPSQIIHVSEYSGITMNGDGAVVYTQNASPGTSCSVSATSSQVGDLAIVDYLWSNANSNLYMRSTGSQQRMWIGVGGPQYGNGGGGAYYVSTDNLYAPNGTVSASASFPSTSNYCYMALIKGAAATSPGFYPLMAQSNTTANTASTNPTGVIRYNLASGSVLVADLDNNGSCVPTSVTDLLGTVFTLENTKTSGTSNEVLEYVGVTTLSGADTVTFHGTCFSNDPAFQFTEYTGITGTVTDTGGQTSGSGTMTWTQNVSNDKSLVHTSCSLYNSTTTGAVSGTGYSVTSAQGEYVNAGIGSRAVVGTAGTSTPSLTMHSDTKNVCGGITLQ